MVSMQYDTWIHWNASLMNELCVLIALIVTHIFWTKPSECTWARDL